MKGLIPAAVLIAACASLGHAQAPMSAAAQVASAVAPLPEEFRATARILGYQPGQKGLTELRAGTGSFTCLADDPGEERFHVACYHNSLEPFMARGRELRASGVTGEAVDSARYEEIKTGKLAMPKQAAALYSITLRPDAVDAQTGAVPTTTKPLYVIYISGATSESTGIPATPVRGMPWIMAPGTPKAHIMFVPGM